MFVTGKGRDKRFSFIETGEVEGAGPAPLVEESCSVVVPWYYYEEFDRDVEPAEERKKRKICLPLMTSV